MAHKISPEPTLEEISLLERSMAFAASMGLNEAWGVL